MMPPNDVPPNRRAPETDRFPTGPDVGGRLPAIVLQDQHGTWTDVDQVRGNRRALIVFHRSLNW